jgi:ADP-ribosylglycohydrolase
VFTLLGIQSVTAQVEKNVSLKERPVEMTKATLMNKIKGGWAGQVIGVTFGGPTEFRYQGSMINDYQPIEWYDGYIKKTMTDNPGLYDDIYMDFTFVDVFEKEGLSAPVTSHAKAYAHAQYMLWHANQAGRVNILNGMRPPTSGHWENNPHADDIDFQIESDFSGLMSPGMPNTAAAIGDSIGHIMNYGDGWYGGVFVGAMYSIAFVSDDIHFIVNEALKTIPAQSTFHQCINDVIRWHKQYPDDWKQNWFEIQKKWSSEVGCPDGVFSSFNIDAKLNAAYIVLGLLYGNGDFSKTMDISTRAGQDSDCNPSSAGGILGTILGYDKIPAHWMQGLKEAEDIDFKYTTVSLNDAYRLSMKHALEVISRNGGKVEGDKIVLVIQKPFAVRLEQSFTGHHPTEKRRIHQELASTLKFDFEGKGFVLTGEAFPKNGSSWDYKGSFVYEVEVSVDGQMEKIKCPVVFSQRRYDLFWKYNLPNGKHTITLKLLNPDVAYSLRVNDLLVYGERAMVRK